MHRMTNGYQVNPANKSVLIIPRSSFRVITADGSQNIQPGQSSSYQASRVLYRAQSIQRLPRFIGNINGIVIEPVQENSILQYSQPPEMPPRPKRQKQTLPNERAYEQQAIWQPMQKVMPHLPVIRVDKSTQVDQSLLLASLQSERKLEPQESKKENHSNVMPQTSCAKNITSDLTSISRPVRIIKSLSYLPAADANRKIGSGKKSFDNSETQPSNGNPVIDEGVNQRSKPSQSFINFMNTTKKNGGSNVTTGLASEYLNDTSFQQIKHVCEQLIQNIRNPDTLKDLRSSAAVKDFIFVFTRVINTVRKMKTYINNHRTGRNGIKSQFSNEFMKIFLAWENSSLEFCANLIQIFINLNKLSKLQKTKNLQNSGNSKSDIKKPNPQPKN